MERKESIDWKFIGKIAFIAGTTVVGTIVAVVAIPIVAPLIGLSTIGPVAGGAFAAAQSAGMISAPVVGTALSVV